MSLTAFVSRRPQAEIAPARSTSASIRICLVMSGLRLDDPQLTRLIIGGSSWNRSDLGQTRKIPDVLGVITRPNPVRRFAVVVEVERGGKRKAGERLLRLAAVG